MIRYRKTDNDTTYANDKSYLDIFENLKFEIENEIFLSVSLDSNSSFRIQI